jgi:hypothetical protein
MAKERMTIEQLSKLFKSNFDLAEHAMERGRYYIKIGHEFTLESLLEDVRRDPDGAHMREMEEDEREEKERDREKRKEGRD